MYAASSSLRDSSTSARMASSSRPSSSTSSVVRWVYSFTSAMAMRVSFRRVVSKLDHREVSDVELAVTDWHGDAGLDVLVGVGVLRAVAQVAHLAGDHGHRAGVADAGAAAVRHAHTDPLSRLEHGGGTVDVSGLAGVAERDRAALAAVAIEVEREPLEVQLDLQPGPLPELLGRIKHRAGTAGPHLTLTPVGAHAVEVLVERQNPVR